MVYIKMAMSEIKGLFRLPSGTNVVCGINIIEKLWWYFMPGVVINVKWPTGYVVLNEMPDGSTVSTFSADPNDHYRPWLEKNVGKQGWDWNWGMGNEDATKNRLTIKFRKSKEHYATVAGIQWI